MMMHLRQKLRQLTADPLFWWSIGLVVVWRALLEIIDQIVAVRLQADALTQWANWDGGWYLSIITHGYQHHGSGQENVAFFPAFPLLTEGVGVVIRLDFVAVGLVLNVLLTLGAVYFLMKVAQLFAQRLPTGQARWIAIASGAGLLVYPASFFLAAFYAEALLVFSLFGGLYGALTKRWWLAVPCMAIASATKVIGVIVVPVVLVMVFEQWRREKTVPSRLIKPWALTLLGVSGLVAFMAHLGIRFGDPLLFYHIQRFWGRNDDGFFVITIFERFYAHLFQPSYFGGRYSYALALLCMALPFVVGAAIVLAWRQQRHYWLVVLGALVLAIPLSTGTLDSLNRYCLLALPLLPPVLLWLHQRVKPWQVYGLYAVSAAAMVFFAQGFLGGRMFAG